METEERTDKIIIAGNLQPDNNRPKSNVVRQQNMVVSTGGVSPCIPATHFKHDFKIMETQEIEQQVLGWSRDEHGNIINRHPVNIANCVTAAKRDNTQNFVQEELHIVNNTKDGQVAVPDGGVFDAAYPNSTTRRGRVQENGTIAPTLMASSTELMRYEHKRIRRLTERELFRLMDVDEPHIDILLNAGIPKTQLAKMAGNSIVVAVLYYIFKSLLIDTQPEAETQLTLF